MTDDELIAKQARRIEELSVEISYYQMARHFTYLEIYGVGGPLNGNSLGYTDDQLLVFHRIAGHLVSDD